MVLGVHWFRTLGLIVWDFKKLSMQITIQKQQFTLYGVKAKAIKVTKKQAVKLGNTIRGTCTLLLTSMTQDSREVSSNEGNSLSHELQLLLSQYA